MSRPHHIHGHAINSDRFRHVLGHMPTGVTVITAHGDRGPVGMAANSVTSVSLNPPLVLFCPAKSSATWPHIRSSSRLCINVMAGHHEAATRQFAGPSSQRFQGIEYVRDAAAPVLAEAVAWLQCSLLTEQDAGDHTIVVVRVDEIQAYSDREPLVFCRGLYGSFCNGQP